MLENLDPANPVPLYLQIVEQVRRLIALGGLRPGDRFLTVRDLAVKARVNRNTAARAIQELERAGLVRTRVGQGTFVAETSDAPPPDREAVVDTAIDHLLVQARTSGVPLEELGWRLSKRIEVFRRRLAAAQDAQKEKA